MKKPGIFLLAVILFALFGWLVYYGLMHARGVPVIVEKKKVISLDVPFIDKDIDLAKDIDLNLWEDIQPKEVELLYQVTVLPWGMSKMSPVYIKAFRNNKDIYFYISWKDFTEDRTVDIGKFPDASAIMFPLKEGPQPSTIMMGFLGSANIWHWKANIDREFWTGKVPEKTVYTDFYYPFEEEELFPVSIDKPESAVKDLNAIRVGTITPKETQRVEGRGVWDKGMWHVVIKRPLAAADEKLDADFSPGTKKLCAFAVWNGSMGDRGGRKSISDWVDMNIAPHPSLSPQGRG